MKKGVSLLLMAIVLILASCSGNDVGKELDYDQTKKMIVDILKTDEGKKAIQDIISEESTKQKLVMDQGIVRETIEQTLVSEKGADFWKNSFQDPKFAESVAKSMKTEHEALLKDLMKDPEYQELMMSILKDPEMQKEYGDLVKSKEFRKHLQKVVSDTIESPTYKAKIQELLLKAAKETEEKSGKDEKKDEDASGGGS
ncbi:spore germination lipoprotein GerD [Bacillus niameyensis]|uniref:spore germination lipoprotein GerD n=1 Tax=Bacillus niameyensis TaxID=1522308 RepID=UPI0007842048|nr:spore germination lipoprotein GerD [Bacillus niameyensis]